MRLRAISVVVLAAALLFGIGATIGRPSPAPAPSVSASPRPASQLADSIGRYQDRLRSVPGDWTTWAALGEAYLEQARISADPAYYPKAEGALRKSLEVRPDDNEPALAGLGALANARHDFAGAERFARQALGVNQWSATAHGVLADALTQLGRPAEATAAVQRMLDLKPGLGSYTRGSYDLEQHGRRTEAIQLMEQALASATEPADVAFCHQHLAALAWAAGDTATATRHVTLGLQVYPETPGLWQLKAKLDTAGGDLDAALADLERVVARTPTVDALLDQARLLKLAGRDPGPALALAQAAHQLFTANGGTDDLGAAAVALEHGRPAEAATLAAQEWQRRQFAEVADVLSWSLLQAGRPAEALPYAQHAVALGQIDATLAYHYGMVALATGDRSLARVQLRLALALNPKFSPVDAPIAARTLDSLSSSEES
ncbi:tetratricopeptide repeat protein [Dactylosporangium sp. NPDC005572]|uniref:tetratricopeptide repeat protein n=1 Tax=Dactylosporangium sp. NPDC005572 TaxID=3156889 RepID=UPI0033A6137C